MYGLNFFSILYPLLMLALIVGAGVLIVLLARLLIAARRHLVASTVLTELRTDLLLAGDVGDDDAGAGSDAPRA